MAKRQSTFDDLIEISAAFPWWVGVILAVAAYFLFHWMAGWELATAKGSHDVSGAMGAQLARVLGFYLQFIVPAAFLIGAASSAFGRWKRTHLLSRGASPGVARPFDDMSWQDFELLVGEAFRRKGFEVHETGGGGADGGVDLVLTAASESYLVQCKQWRALKVDVSTVRELYGVMAATGASGGFVVSAGRFTSAAAEFAKGRNIELIDHDQLRTLAQEARKKAKNSGEPAHRNRDPAAPHCPRCGNEMVQRVAKRGANAGRPFWGCRGYPKCLGTLPIAS